MIFAPARYLHAIRSNGTEYWRYRPSADWTGRFNSVIVGADQTLFATASDGALYALRGDGVLKWRFTTDKAISGTPALGPQATLYVGMDDGWLLALNLDGTEKWRVGLSKCLGSVPNVAYSAPAVGMDNTIYVNSMEGCIYAINPQGHQSWVSILTTYGGVEPPIIGAKNTLYAAHTEDGYLSALNIGSLGFALSPWPMWRSDIQHSGQVNAKTPITDPCFITYTISNDKSLQPSQKRDILEVLRNFRESVLKKSPAGRSWLDIYQRHLSEIKKIMRASPALTVRCAKAIISTWPGIAAAKQNGGIVMSERDFEEIRSILTEYIRNASPELGASLNELDKYILTHVKRDKEGLLSIQSP
jgi:hypothetical protein